MTATDISIVDIILFVLLIVFMYVFIERIYGKLNNGLHNNYTKKKLPL